MSKGNEVTVSVCPGSWARFEGSIEDLRAEGLFGNHPHIASALPDRDYGYRPVCVDGRVFTLQRIGLSDRWALITLPPEMFAAAVKEVTHTRTARKLAREAIATAQHSASRSLCLPPNPNRPRLTPQREAEVRRQKFAIEAASLVVRTAMRTSAAEMRKGAAPPTP